MPRKHSHNSVVIGSTIICLTDLFISQWTFVYFLVRVIYNWYGEKRVKTENWCNIIYFKQRSKSKRLHVSWFKFYNLFFWWFLFYTAGYKLTSVLHFDITLSFDTINLENYMSSLFNMHVKFYTILVCIFVM